MDNYMENHLMKSALQVRKKPWNIPTKFYRQSDRNTRTSNIWNDDKEEETDGN